MFSPELTFACPFLSESKAHYSIRSFSVSSLVSPHISLSLPLSENKLFNPLCLCLAASLSLSLQVFISPPWISEWTVPDVAC